MYKPIVWIFLISILVFSCDQKPESETVKSISENVNIPTERINLWNGNDFSGWTKYVPDSTVNVDTVWTIVDNVIDCSGKPIGYFRTETEYANYKLVLEWRWPEEPGNSGVLLHISPPDKVWPKSIEAQLMSENAGDFYVIGGTDFDEHINKDSRRIEKHNDNSENSPGEWNKYEIICKENTITLYVNGVLQNKATNTSVSYGKIGFQSEGKPIQFKNIFLEPIE
ncbi:MAG: DUF1080 domain-containing protein [Bacteroidota bacterium]